MKKETSILVGMLILSTVTWAHGDGGMDCPCEQSVSASDATCSSSDCTSPTGCVSTSFTASCEGYYKLVVTVFCEQGNCANYNACATVYEGNTIVRNCHIEEPCTACSKGCFNLCLHYSHNYTLYVCLTPCEPTGNCSNPTFCTAQGTLSYCGSGAATCTP